MFTWSPPSDFAARDGYDPTPIPMLRANHDRVTVRAEVGSNRQSPAKSLGCWGCRISIVRCAVKRRRDEESHTIPTREFAMALVVFMAGPALADHVQGHGVDQPTSSANAPNVMAPGTWWSAGRELAGTSGAATPD